MEKRYHHPLLSRFQPEFTVPPGPAEPEDEEEDEEDFTDWTVLDQDKKPVGKVTDLEDIPGNTCLWVRKADGTEVLLPFHEDLLLEADPEKQILILQIPEGILDL